MSLISFESKLNEIITLNNSTSLDEILESFEVKSIDELEKIYIQNREFFINKINNYLSCEYHFNILITKDRQFLEKYSPIVVDYINFQILRCSTKEIESDDYFEWEDREFNYEDFKVDDLLEISRLLINPPLPLTPSNFDNQHLRNKRVIISKLQTENNYKCVDATKYLFDMVIHGKEKGDFKITNGIGSEFFVHSWILTQYPYYNNIIKYTYHVDNVFKFSSEIPSYSDKVTLLFLGFLYGVEINMDLLTDEEVEDLRTIADFTQVSHLLQICEVKMDNRDFEVEYLITTNISRMKKMMKYIIELYLPEGFDGNISYFDNKVESCIRSRNKKEFESLLKEITTFIIENFEDEVEIDDETEILDKFSEYVPYIDQKLWI